MESPSNSLGVSEFKEEDEPTETAVKGTSPKVGYPDATDVSRTEIQDQENETGICRGSDAAEIDCKHDGGGSFNLVETPGLSHATHNGFKSHEQAADVKSNIIESGSVFANVGHGSSLDATMQLDDRSNYGFVELSCNDVSACLTSDADESMSETSPSAIRTSSDGPSSHDCLIGWDLDGESMEIVFYPDYLEYRGTHYLDSVVSFSRSFVVARSKAVYGKEGTFHIHLEVKDIVKIESQWGARYEAGAISIHFISNDEAEINASESAVRELKFPSIDRDWYKKLEAIRSLDAQYKALWRVLLDTGLENCSALSEEEAMMPTGRYFPNFDKPFEEVIYPKGDPDAVSISKRDVDLLLPDTFVNDTIIDFYIKYLKNRQNVEDMTKFHFFNSFFFRKLADMDKDPSSAFDGKSAFQRVRKWTRKVNLLEKDFIFIPVNYNYHWSLIVICYFGEVSSYEDVGDRKSARVPCILHMDSFRGNHLGLKDLIQSYLWEELKERQKGTCEDLNSKFRNLKFVPLELPQQQNLYDCGLFLLHYVELFLEEVPANFSIYKITPSSPFLQADWFPPGEASIKRTCIERLINELLNTHSEDCTQSSGSSMCPSPNCPDTTNGYENGLKFSVKSSPSRGYHENSLCQIGQGIEMTLLPASSMRNTICTGTSGLVLKELFEQTSALEPFNDAPWESLDSRASLLDFKRPVPPTEEKVGASECFVPTELTEPVFQRSDAVTSGAHTLDFSSEDLKLEPVCQPTSDYVGSSPVASGEQLNAVESGPCVGISVQAGDSLSLNNLPEFFQEANHLQDPHASHELSSVSAAFASGDKLDVPESENPNQTAISSHQGHPCPLASNYSPMPSPHEGNGGVAHESVPESDEQPPAKRMRVSPPGDGDELSTSLSQDLHL